MTLFHLFTWIIAAGVGAGLGALFGANVYFCGVIGAFVGFVFSVIPRSK